MIFKYVKGLSNFMHVSEHTNMQDTFGWVPSRVCFHAQCITCQSTWSPAAESQGSHPAALQSHTDPPAQRCSALLCLNPHLPQRPETTACAPLQTRDPTAQCKNAAGQALMPDEGYIQK